jgi:hypothetical protein
MKWEERKQRHDMNSFNFIDYTIVGIYMLSMLVIGFLVSRISKGDADYFKGGNRIPWVMSAMSLFIGSFTAYMFVGASGQAFNAGPACLLLFMRDRHDCGWDHPCKLRKSGCVHGNLYPRKPFGACLCPSRSGGDFIMKRIRGINLIAGLIFTSLFGIIQWMTSPRFSPFSLVRNQMMKETRSQNE